MAVNRVFSERGRDDQGVYSWAARAGIQIDVTVVRLAGCECPEWRWKDGRIGVASIEKITGDVGVNVDRIGWTCREVRIEFQTIVVIVSKARRGFIDAIGDLKGELGEALRVDQVGVHVAVALVPECGKGGAIRPTFSP